ncbi:MAG: MFS transporter, partial [Muribaculaceae bacterium]|nr:MFS transporter [Muribaculaceae bacterium]
FYLGAAVLLICVIYTLVKVKEMPPAEYAAYHGIEQKAESTEKKENIFKLLAKAPKVFWTVGIVQFFCWAAFLYMWTYGTDAIAGHAYKAPSVQKVTGVTVNGSDYSDKYLFDGKTPLIDDGHLTIAGIIIDGNMITPITVVAKGDTLVKDGQVNYNNGVAMVNPDAGKISDAGETIIIDGKTVKVGESATTVAAYTLVKPGSTLTLAHIAKKNGSGDYILEQTTDLPSVRSAEDIDVQYTTVLNAASKQYQDAGNWNGILLAIQSIAALLWAVVLSSFKSRRLGYSVSLLIGGIGFISTYFFANPNLLAISYALEGCAWAAMLAMPFTILTNALSGNHIGTYLGLFNCTICIPQIIAAICGGAILSMFPAAANGAPNTIFMLVVSGILLIIGSLAVWNVKET